MAQKIEMRAVVAKNGNFIYDYVFTNSDLQTVANVLMPAQTQKKCMRVILLTPV